MEPGFGQGSKRRELDAEPRREDAEGKGRAQRRAEVQVSGKDRREESRRGRHECWKAPGRRNDGNENRCGWRVAEWCGARHASAGAKDGPGRERLWRKNVVVGRRFVRCSPSAGRSARQARVLAPQLAGGSDCPTRPEPPASWRKRSGKCRRGREESAPRQRSEISGT